MASDQDKPLSAYPLLPLLPDIPSDADALSARAQIRIAEAELRRLDVELSIILARRARVIARLDRCRTVIAPYKRLPIELVRKIMVLFVSGVDAESTSFAHPDRKQSRLLVTQICATWRRIAFGESAIWNLIFYPCKASVELAGEWFRQSTSSYLGLTLSCPFEGMRILSIAAKIITPYSNRFRSLSLPVDKAMLKYISSQPFDNLKKLSLILTHEPHDHWGEPDAQFGIHIPSLRSLEIVLPSAVFDDQFLLGLPLPQLTKLKLKGDMLGTHLIRALSECASLEKCTIWGNYIGNHPHDTSALMQDTTIFLPHLRYLKIISVSDISPILCSLDTPNLCSLVTNVEIASPRCHAFFRGLSHLRCIEMVGTTQNQRFIDENFLVCILPSVEIMFDRYFLQQSTLIKIAAGELLPNIEHLKISTHDLHSVLDMLSARNLKARESLGNISFIKKATIFSDGREETFKDVLADFRSNGVDIVVELWPQLFSFS